MRLTTRLLLTVLMVLLAAPRAAAQTTRIQGFTTLRQKDLRREGLKTDKTQAVLELVTAEKGFTFKADGKTDLTPQEGDDKITLLMPDKTASITVTHPEYGQLAWRAPVRRLRRRHYYRAYLLTSSPKKEYRAARQWTVFYFSPDNAILYVDSVRHTVSGGKIQLYLPVGRHACRAEAPFYDEWKDVVTVTDSVRTDVDVRLQPLYSYLTVRTPLADAAIRLDGDSIGVGSTVSRRIMAGHHRLTITRRGYCYYNDWVDIDTVAKKVVTLTGADLHPVAIPRTMTPAQMVEMPVAGTASSTGGTTLTAASLAAADTLTAAVHITAAEADAEILIDREPVAVGEWTGHLPRGYHVVSARKDGMESVARPLTVEDRWPQEILLETTQSGSGVVSIVSDVVDADIYIDGRYTGKTPLQLSLAAGRACRITLRKDGYRSAETTTVVRGNEMNRLYINMKPKRK